MSKLRGMIHGLIKKARSQLHQDLLLLNLNQHEQVQKGSTLIPALDLSALRDNPTNITNGQSFLSGNESILSINEADQLHNQVFTESYLQQQFILADSTADHGQSSIHQRPAQIKKYFDAIYQFKKDLLVLIHMTGGSPGRGTKILTVRHRNNSTSEGRGIFMNSGLMNIIVSYHKGYNFSVKSKIIH